MKQNKKIIGLIIFILLICLIMPTAKVYAAGCHTCDNGKIGSRKWTEKLY